MKKKNEWKNLFNLLKKAKLPYGWIIFAFLLPMASSIINIIFPQYIQQLMEGNMSDEVVLGATVLMLIYVIFGGLTLFVFNITIAKTDVKRKRM